VESLLLVVLAEEYVSNPSQHSCIVGQFGQNNLIPLEGLLGTTDDFVDIGNLEYGLRNRYDGLYLLQGLF